MREEARILAEMGAPEVTQFLTALAIDRRVAASTQNQALSALLFLYRDVLEVDLPWLDGVVRAERANQIVVRGGKGDRDRVTMLPAMAKPGSLVRHLEAVRAQHDADLAIGAGWVELPTARLGKYPDGLSRSRVVVGQNN